MKIYLMRGLPGAGKDHWILENSPQAMVCSADFAHIGPDGIYRFTPEGLKRGHAEAFLKYIGVIMGLGFIEPEILVVNNTNLAAWELAPYVRMAEVYDMDYEIIQVECPPEVAAARNIHGVPGWRIGMMYHTLLTERLPPWWKMRIVPFSSDGIDERRQGS
jgi:predicted kinase